MLTAGSTQVEVVTRLTDLEALSPEWQNLAHRRGTPLLHHDWFVTCAEVLHDEGALRIVTVRRDDALAAVAPLVLHASTMAPWLEIVGSSRLHEPTGLLFEDERALEALVDAILSLGYPVRIDRLAADGPEAQAFARRRSHRALVFVRRTGSSCSLDLPDDWERFFARLSPKWRAGLLSKQRKARTFGDARFEEHRPGLAELAPLLDAAFIVEAAGWKSRAGSSLRQNDLLRRFFERYAGRAAGRGALRVYFYRIGTRIVAMRIAVEAGGRLWFLKTGYDEAWARLSPGMQLTSDIVQRAIDQRLTGCEFLGADEPWQHAWPVAVTRYCSVIAFPMSGRGLAAMLDTFLTVVHTRVQRRLRSHRAASASAERTGRS